MQNVYLKNVHAILQVSARINKRVHQSTPLMADSIERKTTINASVSSIELSHNL